MAIGSLFRIGTTHASLFEHIWERLTRYARAGRESYEARRQNRADVRQIQHLLSCLDDRLLEDVTGLSRADAERTLRLPAAKVRCEFARLIRIQAERRDGSIKESERRKVGLDS